MKHRNIALQITMIVLLLIMPFNVSAQGVPGAISHQGQLLDSGGSPVTTEVTIIFSLWDAATVGTHLGSAWTDSDTVTPDANGVYSTEIGDDPGNPVPASALASATVWLNVNVEGEDLLPRSRLLTVPYAASANTLNGESFVTVATTSDPVSNGQNLLAAYNTAKAMTPHGDDRATTNRVTVIVPPGRYDLTTSSLTLDTEFVDLVGLSTARDSQYIFGLSNGANTGVLMQSANDVRIENLYVECTRASGSLSFGSSAPSAYFPNDAATTDTVVRNCEFKTDDTNAMSMRLGIAYPGTFENCTGGAGAFGSGSGGIASGTFSNCTGGEFAFGGNQGTASGTFTNCTGGRFAFGGFFGTANGTFTNCTGGTGAFGGDGGTASGTFTNCTGGDDAFGGGSGTAAGGRFYFCQGGSGSMPATATLRRYCDQNGTAIND